MRFEREQLAISVQALRLTALTVRNPMIRLIFVKSCMLLLNNVRRFDA